MKGWEVGHQLGGEVGHPLQGELGKCDRSF